MTTVTRGWIFIGLIITPAVLYIMAWLLMGYFYWSWVD